LEPSLGGKWLEVLAEIAPGLKRVAIMFNPDSTVSALLPPLETAARSLKVVPIMAPVHREEEIETAIFRRRYNTVLRGCVKCFTLLYKVSQLTFLQLTGL
jgi:hypothetical protein